MALGADWVYSGWVISSAVAVSSLMKEGFSSGELSQEATTRRIRAVRQEGKHNVPHVGRGVETVVKNPNTARPAKRCRHLPEMLAWRKTVLTLIVEQILEPGYTAPFAMGHYLP